MDTSKLSHIGKKLTEYADNYSIPKLSQNSMLAPYIEHASENMTMREISAYVSGNFDYSISASTVSRIITNRDEHYYHLASYLKSAALWIAPKHDATPSGLFVTRAELENEDWESGLSGLNNVIQAELTDDPSSEVLLKHKEIASELYDVWENLPDKAQNELLDIMNFNPEE